MTRPPDPKTLPGLLQLSRPLVMGVINVTPDSFSDGSPTRMGRAALDHAFRLIEEGADIIDVGGESTRPGAIPISAQEDLDRVMPVIEGLKACGKIVSVDTRHALTMRWVIKHGIKFINDISALEFDSQSINEIKDHPDVHICLMHMQGTPQTMQKNPNYSNVVKNVYEYLDQRIKFCETAGIGKNRIIVDPGIGFGKNLEHNLLLIRNVSKFTALGLPILLGVSRKSFIERVCSGSAPDQRLGGSLAAALWAAEQGVKILRVHDVHDTVQALSISQAIREAGIS